MSVRTPRHAASHRRPSRWARGAGLAALSVALFGTSTFAIAYNDIQTNIDRHDIDDLLGDRPTQAGQEEPAPLDPSAGKPINILVLGSDTRAGDVNDEYGTTPEAGQRSDTTMIAHISADRERVEIVSIPRDSLVTIPACRMADGSWTEPQYETMFNRAFSTGADGGDLGTAAACTIGAVEELTDVYIDDFVVVDFAGFINVIDALGGVPMCIPEAISDPKAKLDLEAGEQVLDGRDALGFARARYTLGDGSDIARIGRQQELVGAIAREALSKNLLTDLPKLYRFLDAATSTLTTGTELGSIPTMAGLAYSLRGINLENIVFETMPFEWAGNRVRPAAEAEELWEALRTDEPIEGALNATGEEPTEEPSDDGTDAPEEPTTEEPPVVADPEPICP
ncbi:LCP family protein [Georgenia satyanarayanai]|uniref:LCP family protein n=1 Tax=Georgenia satyanarayanai TaxID=860221 RepID=UPI001264BE4D|nr:LCP family protein [Georgenia satyanarayanai]